jgi:hypothetical protein
MKQEACAQHAAPRPALKPRVQAQGTLRSLHQQLTLHDTQLEAQKRETRAARETLAEVRRRAGQAGRAGGRGDHRAGKGAGRPSQHQGSPADMLLRCTAAWV